MHSVLCAPRRGSPSALPRMRAGRWLATATSADTPQLHHQWDKPVILPSDAYRQLVARNVLAHDEAQWRITKRFFDKLHRQLHDYRLPSFSDVATTPRQGVQDGDVEPCKFESADTVQVPRGLYIHGNVGTGKSMLMDLFFEHAPVAHKRRVHFNKFMLEVHQRLQRVKREQLEQFGRQRNIVLDPSRDAIGIVAEMLVVESHLLCFDEFQVTDIADAMIMRKLFGVFFNNGGVMVATSNTAPHELYRDGTNREYFLPFLHQLAAQTKVVDIKSVIDYRTLSQRQSQQSFFHPLSAESVRAVNAVFDELTAEELIQVRVPVMMGRILEVKATPDGVARVSFDEMCDTERGAADFKALSEHFHTVILEGVPQLQMKSHDQARRFILLIDELYEHRTRLICSSAVPAAQIFAFDDAPLVGQAEALADSEVNKKEALGERERERIPTASSWDAPVGAYNPAKMAGLQIQNLCSLQDLKIAFKRAVSRISEMQGDNYLLSNQEFRRRRQESLAKELQE